MVKKVLNAVRTTEIGCASIREYFFVNAVFKKSLMKTYMANRGEEIIFWTGKYGHDYRNCLR